MKCPTVSSQKSFLNAGASASVRTLADILNSGRPEEVQDALAELAKQKNSHLDLSDIRLTSQGLEAVCSVIGNPLSNTCFEKVTWGWVPDFQPVLECLPYTSAKVFDISRLRSEFKIAHFAGVATFDNYGALRKVHEYKGPFKAAVVVDSQGDKDSRAELEQLRQQGIHVSDIWRQTLLHAINSGDPGSLPRSWYTNVDIDLHFNVGDAQVLTRRGLSLLVDSMNNDQAKFMKNSLVLGRVNALDEFFAIHPSRVPKRLDLSHVRICASEADEGTALTNHHARRLSKLIQPMNDKMRSLEVLCIDASRMSEQAVQGLQSVCDRAKVNLEIAPQNTSEGLSDPVVPKSSEPGESKPFVQSAHEFVITGHEGSAERVSPASVSSPQATGAAGEGSGASPDAVDRQLSKTYSKACKEGSARWIAQQLTPQIVAKLDPTVVGELRAYANGLVGGYGSLFQGLGAIILRQLPDK